MGVVPNHNIKRARVAMRLSRRCVCDGKLRKEMYCSSFFFALTHTRKGGLVLALTHMIINYFPSGLHNFAPIS